MVTALAEKSDALLCDPTLGEERWGNEDREFVVRRLISKQTVKLEFMIHSRTKSKLQIDDRALQSNSLGIIDCIALA